MVVVIPLKIPNFPNEGAIEITELLVSRKLQPLAIALRRYLEKKRELSLLDLIELAVNLSGDKELEEEFKRLIEEGAETKDIIKRLTIKSAENGSNFHEKWLEVKKVVQRFAEVQLVAVNDSGILYTPERAQKLFMLMAELV
ncbi:hypothetical protein E3E31_08185 [Thermococcus sp. M39]|uniref:hypothetical protein n=1 Tax=unclassified Thermococcus TaxID=2627626 RepID=UPI00143AB9EB|nr:MULTISPECIES: hypothetical protein [unclassified Thermococcus]NJE08499.1 hypothetical protein [Thermococcus sp. M39]NJE13834.1 hypothetical protein [Thermococcus sp. LS2]